MTNKKHGRCQKHCAAFVSSRAEEGGHFFYAELRQRSRQNRLFAIIPNQTTRQAILNMPRPQPPPSPRPPPRPGPVRPSRGVPTPPPDDGIQPLVGNNAPLTPDNSATTTIADGSVHTLDQQRPVSTQPVSGDTSLLPVQHSNETFGESESSAQNQNRSSAQIIPEFRLDGTHERAEAISESKVRNAKNDSMLLSEKLMPSRMSKNY